MPHFETLERHHNFAITLAFYVIQSGQARRQGRGAAGIVSPAAAGASSAADVSAFLGAGGGPSGRRLAFLVGHHTPG